MKLKDFLEKNKLNQGDLIEFEFNNQIIKGTIIPSQNELLKIKINSGYNAGFDFTKLKNIKNLGKAQNVGKAQKIKTQKNESLKTISLLHTGGTIASRVDYKTGGVYASFDAEDLATMFPELVKIANFNSVLVSNMMSEDMTLKDYQKIAKFAEAEIKKGTDGIIIGHGTDTLGYSAAFLSFALKNCPIPVLLVGAQRSSDRGSSDAGMNLICAAEFITKTNFKGVAICMHDSTNDNTCAILPANKTRKMHTSRRDAFKAINSNPLALIDYKTKKIEYKTKINKEEKTFEFLPKVCEKVAILRIHPGINEKIIDFYKKEKYEGLIIEGTGLGHTPLGENEIFIKKIKSLVESGCIVAMTSQCINGRVNNRVYSTLIKLSNAGVIYCEDMLAETAFVKLGFLLGNYSKKKASELLNQNLCGEISEFSKIDNYKPDLK